MTAINSSFNTTGISFTASDTLTLASDAYVIATTSDALTLNGTAEYDLTVSGLLQSMTTSICAGIYAVGSVTGTITIEETGVTRGDAGIYLDGNMSITNHGAIFAIGNAGIYYAGASDTTVMNTGLISTGEGFAVYFTDNAVGTHTVENAGTIYSTSVAIDGNLDSVELVTNTGVITGEVNLAGGNDVVHNERGTINGKINLEDGDDEFYGGLSGMFIYGGAGRDKITGGTHSDVIDGGADTDTLRGAGGKDLFSFNDVAESGLKAGKRDIIADFKRGQDQIGLSEIDAIVGGVDEEFTLLARGTATSAVGSGKIGFYWEDNAGKANDRTIIRINNDTDAKIEMTIEFSGLHKLQDSDFVL